MSEYLVSEELLRKIIREELKSNHICQFGLNKSQAENIRTHLLGLNELGAQEMRENHLWWSNVRRSGKWGIMIFAGTVIAGMASATVYTIWEGAKHFIGKP